MGCLSPVRQFYKRFMRIFVYCVADESLFILRVNMRNALMICAPGYVLLCVLYLLSLLIYADTNEQGTQDTTLLSPLHSH